MRPVASWSLDTLEALASMDIENCANVRMRGLLRRKLASHLGGIVAEKVASTMGVDLADAAVDEEYLERVSTLYAGMIIRLRNGFVAQGFDLPDRALVNCSGQLSLTLKL